MKKTLVALAALAATGAFAQSSVTLYGVADAWLGSNKSVTTATVGNVSTATGIRQTVLNSGGLSGSRFGLKGSEDLGGGLKANFQFENQFQIDTGELGAQNAGATVATMFGRQAFVGLSGGFGSVTVGNQYTSYDDVRGAFDPQSHSGFSATAGGAWAAGRDYTFRANNSIRFDSNNYGGFSFGATYALGENKTATVGAGSLMSLKGVYSNGPIAVGFGHQVEKNAIFGQGTGIAATGTKETHTVFTGSYDFGVAKLGMGYNIAKDDATARPGNDKEFQIGVTVPMGAATIIADLATSKAAATASSNGHKSRAFGVQALYALSKRTNLYVAMRDQKTDTTYNTPVAGTANQVKASRLGFGVRHTF